MRKQIKTTLCAVLCGVSFLSGCGGKADPDHSEITVSEAESAPDPFFPAEACGVRLEKAVEKAVSLSPAATEIIFELGFGDRIVGVSDYCDYPANISAAKTGSTENPDIDAIIKLSPDAVFTLSELSERDIYALNEANISVLTARPPHDPEGYSALYREIASAFYGTERTDGGKEELKAVQIGADARSALEKAAKETRLESFVYVTSRLTIAGANTFENAVLSLCGKNLCVSEGYAAATELGGEAPKYIIADSALTLDDLNEIDELYDYISEGAEVRFVSSRCFERPTARTAEVFAQLLRSDEEPYDEE